jgi:uncharacterized protein
MCYNFALFVGQFSEVRFKHPQMTNTPFFPKCLIIFTLLLGCKTMPISTPTVHTFRLKPGEDLKQGILNEVKTRGIEAGHISTCVGSLLDYSIRFANQKTATTSTGHFEIVSLTGIVSIHGSHVHISVSDEKGNTVGGHLMVGSKVYTTAEVVIIEDTYGYEELKVGPREPKK